MVQVRIPVRDVDGKYRGSVFKDGPGYANRWTGAAKLGVQEVMVCAGTIENGPWYLLEYVLPREISGDEECDSLFDERSLCCVRTSVQALHWFTLQAFGPPPALVESVRDFVKAWRTYGSSQPCKDLLQLIIDRGHIYQGDAAFRGDNAWKLQLLRSVHLLSTSESGGNVSFSAASVVIDMGLESHITWTNEHIASVSQLLAPKQEHVPTAPEADARQLIGWIQILPVLGFDKKDRNARDRVKRLNKETDGPIKVRGERGVIANHGSLLQWWKTAAERADTAARARATSDKNARLVDAALNSGAFREANGLHARERPNRRKQRTQ